ncbi:MAG: hypothetical protein LUD39_07205, partial [Opitutae bacterium]|nr:hypothetical protein [Opitutae bacterium]MCD8299516.1 hypothetical protein [Opitutae bacterium]
MPPADNTLPEEILIRPPRKLSRLSVVLPGSKSITNRALILAALGSRTTILHGALFSDDTRAMLDCLKKLGFDVAFDEAARTISVRGEGGEIPNSQAELFVENAGTAARFIVALLALKKGGNYVLDGTKAMRKRPMRGLLDALEKLGCEFTFAGEVGHFPFSMKTRGIVADSVAVDAAASSQILSALLLIAPCAAKPGKTFSIELLGATVSRPFVAMTLSMIRQFGGATEARGNTFVCAGAYPTTNPDGNNFVYEIEPDATAASYFAILPFVHHECEIEIPGFATHGGLQGDAAFATTIATPPHDLISLREIPAHNHKPSTTIVAAGTSQQTFDADFNAISDTFLTLAAVAPLFATTKPRVGGGNNAETCHHHGHDHNDNHHNGDCCHHHDPQALTIRGIAHTRRQETNRVAAMATELAKIVGEKNVQQTEDSLSVIPCALSEIRARADAQPDGAIRIETYNDHRVAMSFAVLATFDLRGDGSPWLAIKNPRCCAKTFPDFFSRLPQG